MADEFIPIDVDSERGKVEGSGHFFLITSERERECATYDVSFIFVLCFFLGDLDDEKKEIQNSEA